MGRPIFWCCLLNLPPNSNGDTRAKVSIFSCPSHLHHLTPFIICSIRSVISLQFASFAPLCYVQYMSSSFYLRFWDGIRVWLYVFQVPHCLIARKAADERLWKCFARNEVFFLHKCWSCVMEEVDYQIPMSDNWFVHMCYR